MNIPNASATRGRNVLRAYVLPIFLTCVAVVIALPAHAVSAVKIVPAAGGHPSQAITVSATGFGDSEAVDIYFDTVDTLLFVTSGTGTLSGSLTLPASASPGTHYVTAIGRHSGDAAQVAVTVSTPWAERGFGAGSQGWNPYENTLNTSNVSQLGLLWEAPTELNGGGVGVVGGRVISAGSPGGVQSRSPTTGALQWSALTSGSFAAGPAVSGGVVYIAGYNGSIEAMTALKATTGAVIWTQPMGSSSESSPVVVNGVVYVGCDDNNVYAFNATTGAILWTYATGGAIKSSPAVVNGIVYVSSEAGGLYALTAPTGTATTGVLVWSFLTDGSFTSASPVVANGRVFIQSAISQGTFFAFDADSGAQIWSGPTGLSAGSAVAAANGRVYGVAGQDTVYAAIARTGKNIWSVKTSAVFTSSAAPIVANGVVYVGDSAGNFYAFDAEDGTELNSANSLHAILGASVTDGVVYFSDNINTYAYGLKAGADAVGHVTIEAPKPASLIPDLSLTVTSDVTIPSREGASRD
jgi:outer membrane protein assembly factor BamB